MNTVKLITGEQLVVELIDGDGGDSRLLGREPVLTSDLALARDETWREGIRKGQLDHCLPSSFSMKVVPGKDVDGHLAGFGIELQDGGPAFHQPFSIYSLASVARRRAAVLLQQKTLPSGSAYSYFLKALPCVQDQVAETAETDSAGNGVSHRVAHHSQPVPLEEAPLDDYLRRSEIMPRETAPLEDEEEAPPMPVFVSEDLWQQGFDLARRGGERESAAVFTGRLMRDTATPEVFLVVDACVEAEHAEEAELSVTFSGETWSTVREVLRQRRKRLNRPHERIIGTVHGHNFLPAATAGGQRMCEACATTKYCGRTTAVASIADFEWFAAVFAGQPWAFSLIHGYNARGENDWRLYHLDDGSLAPERSVVGSHERSTSIP